MSHIKKQPNSEETIIQSRRDFVAGMFATYGGLGLKTLLLGLPPSFIARRAMAATNPTYLIFSTRRAADPVNCNVPGTYINGLDHGDTFATPTAFTLGNQMVQAAQPWSTLPVELRNQLHFFHHATDSNAHTEAEKVLRASGALVGPTGNGVEMIPSAIAQHTAAGLGTITKKPLVIGNTGTSITYDGKVQGRLAPRSLQRLMADSGQGNQADLMAFRDQQLDRIYASVKTSGSKAQKEFLDRHIKSRDQAKNLGTQLGQLLADVSGNTERDATIAALASLASGTAPVAMIGMSWGGDNHGDSDLATEIAQTTASVAELAFMWERINSLGLAGRTTYAQLNVFGRTLRRNSRGGRDHNQHHSVMVMHGPKVAPGVSGGITIRDDQYGGEASGINSTDGSTSFADITKSQTLASAAKTLMAACGLDSNEYDSRVTVGKVVQSAIKSI